MRVCFFGGWDPAYPRNRILRDGLAAHGVTVIEARAPAWRAFRRWPALLAAFSRVARESDVILVPEFRHKDVPLAWLLAGRRPLVFDPLVSRHDTLVSDWALHAPDSFQSRWNRWIDRRAFTLSDRILCDTWEHGRLFESLGAPQARLSRVLVGAERAFFEVSPPPAGTRVEIVYVGGFLPLHGVPVIVEALARLERDTDLPDYRVRLIGRGIEHDAVAIQLRERGLARVEMPGARPYAELPGTLASAHVVLGAFGAGAKAGRVIPHKIYQGLAAGRAVVTGDGPGLREVFEPGRHLEAVSRGEPQALAVALASLLRDAGRRATLGACGQARALEVATPERIGASLIEALQLAGAR